MQGKKKIGKNSATQEPNTMAVNTIAVSTAPIIVYPSGAGDKHISLFLKKRSEEYLINITASGFGRSFRLHITPKWSIVDE